MIEMAIVGSSSHAESEREHLSWYLHCSVMKAGRKPTDSH
jgi:hypothetical protein